MPRILVIDDDAAVRAAMQLLLQAEGFEVVTAPDGSAGAKHAADNDIDLVIVDIFMPGMDGIETIRALRSRQPSLPIIAVSGFMCKADAEWPDYLSVAKKFGAVTSLPKPFRSYELLHAVRQSLSVISNQRSVIRRNQTHTTDY
jgi:CheY-like chemotaxis protein